MTLDTRSQEEILNALILRARQRGIGLTNFSTGSVIRMLCDLMSDEIYDMNGYIQDCYDSFDINNRTGEDLDVIGEAIGVSRKSATKAVGDVTFYTGDSPATSVITIPQGYTITTRVVNDDDEEIEFETIVAKSITVGQSSVVVPVRAVEAGSVSIPLGNLDTLSDTIVGINSCMNTSAIISGVGAQTDEDYRKAIKNRSSKYCNKTAIEEACTAVEGIHKCWVTDGASAGTINVTFAFDTSDVEYNQNTVSPEAMKVLYATKSAGIIPSCYPAEYENVGLTVYTWNSDAEYSSSSTALYIDLNEEQKAYLTQLFTEEYDKIEPSGLIYWHELNRKANDYLAGFDIKCDVTINGSYSDYQLTTGKLPSIGTILWNPENPS